MFYRLFQVIRAAFDNLLGKVEDPAIMLEKTYQGWRDQIVQLRALQVQTAAAADQLQLRMEEPDRSAEEKAEMAKQLQQLRKQIEQAKSRLSELENQITQAEGKKQMLMGLDRNSFNIFDASYPRGIVLLLVILLFLFFYARFYVITHHL